MINFKEYIKQYNLLESENADGVVFTFGRFNPITKGHEENINELKNLGKKYNFKPMVFTSFTHDNIKNPLPPDIKIQYLKKFFNIYVNEDRDLKNAYQILEFLSNQYKKVYFVVGEDRISDFNSMKKYAKQWGIEDFRIIKSGDRKSGVSGTEMRLAIQNQDFETFRSLLPHTATTKDANNIYSILQKNLKEN